MSKTTGTIYGKILYQLQTSYVGSEVIYQCDDQSKEISQKCLPGGIWDGLGAECKSKFIAYQSHS